jgi:hypothetical protein
MRIASGLDSWTPSSQLDQTASRMAAMAAKRASELKPTEGGRSTSTDQQQQSRRPLRPTSTFDTYA